MIGSGRTGQHGGSQIQKFAGSKDPRHFRKESLQKLFSTRRSILPRPKSQKTSVKNQALNWISVFVYIADFCRLLPQSIKTFEVLLIRDLRICMVFWVHAAYMPL